MDRGNLAPHTHTISHPRLKSSPLTPTGRTEGVVGGGIGAAVPSMARIARDVRIMRIVRKGIRVNLGTYARIGNDSATVVCTCRGIASD